MCLVFVAPFGMTKVRQRFGESIAWTGKMVFHCHFLDHEDQGMISSMMILDPNAVVEGDLSSTDTDESQDLATSVGTSKAAPTLLAMFMIWLGLPY